MLSDFARSTKHEGITWGQHASFCLHVSYPKEVNEFTLNRYLKMAREFKFCSYTSNSKHTIYEASI
jgi:hypothetical protein